MASGIQSHPAQAGTEADDFRHPIGWPWTVNSRPLILVISVKWQIVQALVLWGTHICPSTHLLPGTLLLF